ncbi:MAG: hypothetical protein CVU13_04930 [Bacteroidetes bacterium HGW-Bacteroidetes-8]|nr:MAG: hypothetical protein CVU13_04930 [Bacteroidetes bacterium HGW-Bacteroidetes-8]
MLSQSNCSICTSVEKLRSIPIFGTITEIFTLYFLQIWIIKFKISNYCCKLLFLSKSYAISRFVPKTGLDPSPLWARAPTGGSEHPAGLEPATP